MTQQRFPVGYRFIPRSYQGRGKDRRVYTIVDYYVTTNLKGEVVDCKYVCEYEFCGQKMQDKTVVDTTIAMGLRVTFW